ncbi:hypothetical protein A3D66_00525 [Candidatus Kaiserbacteria bacterium RIFCSPHIGHO2_02_FULL_50_9]|uniref:Uncharacterized protein n=1 Tax=Candidatus Kaiserbacteria bacterium RIFCSPLOWO2_01_FULL_51_21 TaxID=1798508 RepID=A0A1F6ECR5_9BACT|nr:MAG: hypothetical protein A2761_01110 [Candidatus Kaiserbacteria bacterium RIFCSPHIGHO2_01_FULL_51_33]OGG63613.1 MAG: hypothetical protein A3D66_00525 [Candidatus Kaiserbacteria bacterium RIFCSPHIGHO2_02_FULL_50_9]OGG71436.1 MAG: hypothetical protein A3A35_03245 [Candidatus Kaiserbacteria bacterium RIFCSPLOWO2_01_FULL_51_21]
METEEKIGWDEESGSYRLPMPANLHVHFREEPEMMELVIPETAKRYRYATAMPNLGANRIRTPSQAIEYRKKILSIAHKTNPHFDVNVPLYLEPDTAPEVVREGFERGAWIAAKLYPKAGTTHSDYGLDFNALGVLDEVFEVMQEIGMVLLVHTELVQEKDGSEIDPFRREERGLFMVQEILKRFPDLKVVIEHLSSKKGVEVVRGWQKKGCPVEATVAPQYLVWNRTRLFQGGLNPADYSIPVLKEEEDRQALVSFLLEGGGFLGTDSAPHPISIKSRGRGCPGGVFNEPVGLSIYFSLFKDSGREGWFEKFVRFACQKGPAFYGIPAPKEQALLKESPSKVPELFGEGSGAIEPMGAGETIPWQIERLA